MVTAPTKLQPYLAALGVIGIVSIFVPLTRKVAPFDVIVFNAPEILGGRLPNWYDIWLILLASPFFLAIPITTASLKRLWAGRLSRVAWLTSYGLALVMAAATLGFVGLGVFEKALPTDRPLEEYLVMFSPQEYLVLLLPLAILILGAGWVIRNRRRRLVLHAINAVIAMQVAYIANGVLCLALFQDDWKNGAYITLATVIVYLTNIVLVSLSTRPTAAVSY
jgi:hypothetical protein